MSTQKQHEYVDGKELRRLRNLKELKQEAVAIELGIRWQDA